jgi:hypothetical protein
MRESKMRAWRKKMNDDNNKVEVEFKYDFRPISTAVQNN